MIPDYQHSNWGEGNKLLGVPTFLSGIVGFTFYNTTASHHKQITSNGI